MVRYIVAASAVVLLVFAVSLNESGAFERYNDGCQSCHGAFTDDTSTKGSIFPGDDKHTMHRSSQAMNAECDLCHSSNDNNNPYIGSSDGTNNNPGIGCNGCHNEFGLRAHHLVNGEEGCSFCHTGDPAPPAENDASGLLQHTRLQRHVILATLTPRRMSTKTGRLVISSVRTTTGTISTTALIPTAPRRRGLPAR